MLKMPSSTTPFKLVVFLGLTFLAIWGSLSGPLGSSASFQALKVGGRDNAVGVLSCAEPTHQFGEVFRPVESLRWRFVFKNVSSQEQFLKESDLSCNCAESKLTKTSLKPGESAALEVVWRPRNEIGVAAFTASVTSAISGDLLLKFTGTVNIHDWYEYSPRVLDFGMLKPGDLKKIRLEIKPHEGDKLPDNGQLGVFCDDSTIKATVIQATPKLLEIEVAARGEAGQRAASGAISVGVPPHRTISVPYLAEHLGRIKISSKVVVIKREGNEKPNTVTISDSSEKELAIVDLVADQPNLLFLKFEQGRKNEGTVYISLIKSDHPPSPFTSGNISFGLRGESQTFTIRYLIIW